MTAGDSGTPGPLGTEMFPAWGHFTLRITGGPALYHPDVQGGEVPYTAVKYWTYPGNERIVPISCENHWQPLASTPQQVKEQDHGLNDGWEARLEPHFTVRVSHFQAVVLIGP